MSSSLPPSPSRPPLVTSNPRHRLKLCALRSPILFTLAALLVWRLGTSIPIPGIDTAVFEGVFGGPGGVSCMFNLCGWEIPPGPPSPLDPFASGADAASMFALTLLPFISAAIIVWLVHGRRASGGGGP
jgi:preprotein translocase subunit SecY